MTQMQTQTHAGRKLSPKSAYFSRIAEDCRGRLLDLDVRVIRYDNDIARCNITRDNPKFSGFWATYDHLKKQQKETRSKMERALFQAGRV